MANFKPQYSISTSVAIRKGKYVKGPSFGLWLNDNGSFPMARGSVKENYLDELIEFLQKCQKRELSASFALFKNDTKKGRKSDDDDGEWSSKRSKDDDGDGGDADFDEKPKKKSRREEPEDEDEKPSKKTSSKSSKSSGKESKKSEWNFDDE